MITGFLPQVPNPSDKEGTVAAYVEILRVKAYDLITLLDDAKKQDDENRKTGLDNMSAEQKERTRQIERRIYELRSVWFVQQSVEAKSKFTKHLSLE